MLLALAIVGLFFIPDPWRVILLGIAAVIEIGEVYFWIKFLRRYRVTTGAEGMIGELGEVISPCRPEGQVRVRGEIWNARCEPQADLGERIRIKAIEDLTLIVEPTR